MTIMARLPRPIRRLFRRFKGESQSNPNAVNPQLVGTYPRSSLRLYLPIPIVLILLAAGVVIAGAQVVQAVRAGDSRVQIAAPGDIGTLHSVFLLGNQVFIGTLEAVDRGTVVLSDVFYLQSQAAQSASPMTSPQSAPPRGAQLVRRVDSDWHQPTRMSIPIDRVVMIENVGRDSIVGRLVLEGRARQQGGQPAR